LKSIKFLHHVLPGQSYR